MTAKTLMVQGTMSSAGKSLLVTALCRIFARDGVRVAPFKAQNMSNNAAVCADGGEIGRAQYTQALACGLQPTVQMNPVLLKPEADARSQVVINGRVWESLPARRYYERKALLWEHVTRALDYLRDEYELVIIEGAGSPVELNLKRGDIVNMAVAVYADAPVLLVGDIDRGGIFAQLLGTLNLLEPHERALVKGVIVNKFRGDPTLFTDGIDILQQRGGVPVLGVVPYVHEHGLPEEDAVAIEEPTPASPSNGTLDIAVIRLPRIANFDDFDPLTREPGVQVRYVTSRAAFGEPDAVIIPGTKSTIADLLWMRERGLDEVIRAAAARGAAVVGICGGYQMLGTAVLDPQHVESMQEAVAGLGLFPLETVFAEEKATRRVQAHVESDAAWLSVLNGQTVSGYEIHMGQTATPSSWLCINDNVRDGAISWDGRVWGCYLHGIFENDNLRRAWLRSLGAGDSDHVPLTFVQRLDYLADHVERALDMDVLRRTTGITARL